MTFSRHWVHACLQTRSSAIASTYISIHGTAMQLNCTFACLSTIIFSSAIIYAQTQPAAITPPVHPPASLPAPQSLQPLMPTQVLQPSKNTVKGITNANIINDHKFSNSLAVGSYWIFHKRNNLKQQNKSSSAVPQLMPCVNGGRWRWKLSQGELNAVRRHLRQVISS